MKKRRHRFVWPTGLGVTRLRSAIRVPAVNARDLNPPGACYLPLPTFRPAGVFTVLPANLPKTRIVVLPQ